MPEPITYFDEAQMLTDAQVHDTLHKPDAPPAPIVYRLNYRGDVTAGILTAEWPLGPTTYGELLWPTTAVYDADADRTRVILTTTPPAGWDNQLSAAVSGTFLDQASRP